MPPRPRESWDGCRRYLWTKAQDNTSSGEELKKRRRRQSTPPRPINRQARRDQRRIPPGVGGAPCGGVFCHQGRYTHGIVGAGAYNRLTSRILSVPKFSARYEEILTSLLAGLFPSERMVPWIDALYSYLGPGVVEEIAKFKTYWCQMDEAEYRGQEEALKRWVPLRTGYILSQIVVPVSDVACAAGPANSVEVTWTPTKAGKVKFGCAMDMMIGGVLLVE